MPLNRPWAAPPDRVEDVVPVARADRRGLGPHVRPVVRDDAVLHTVDVQVDKAVLVAVAAVSGTNEAAKPQGETVRCENV
jgi:hypothetical protein